MRKSNKTLKDGNNKKKGLMKQMNKSQKNAHQESKDPFKQNTDTHSPHLKTVSANGE